MTQSRWKYKTETVTADGNSVEVRGLTYGERIKFGQASRAARDGTGDLQSIIGVLLNMGCVNVTPDDIDTMPAELIEAASDKILELTGIQMGKNEPEPPAGAGAGTSPEKKAP